MQKCFLLHMYKKTYKLYESLYNKVQTGKQQQKTSKII